jgi:hypothetical protein
VKQLVDRDQNRPEGEDIEEGEEVDPRDRDVAPSARERIGRLAAQIE